MPKLRTSIYLGALSLLSTAASAHDGHDHSHWMSDSLHILFYGSLASVVAAVSLVVIKHLKNKNISNKSEEI
ncbi:MAG: hypothetical protein JKY14_09075 [Paraglaciecola sp.]|nr:hypothetical protein [Paraglaciecola sp.]